MLIAAIIFGVLVAFVVAAVLLAGRLVTAYVNRKLRSLPGYVGKVERIEISVWQGRGEASGIVFASRPRSAEPIARVRSLAFDVAWAKLLRGHLSLDIEVIGARVVVEGKGHAKAAAGPSTAETAPEAAREATQRWQEQVYAAFPFEITQLSVRDSEVTYRDPQAEPPIEVTLSSLQIEVMGLSNLVSDAVDGLPARLGLNGNITGEGSIRLLVRADPLAAQPRFEARLQILGVDLPTWSPLLRELIQAEIVEGQFDCSAEVSAAGGLYWGYVKPIVKELKFNEVNNVPATGWRRWKKHLMNWAVGLLGRGRNDRIASKIPFSGNFKETKIDVWTAVESLLRNAFIRGLREGLEGSLPRF